MTRSVVFKRRKENVTKINLRKILKGRETNIMDREGRTTEETGNRRNRIININET